MKPDYRRWGSGSNPPCPEDLKVDILYRSGTEVENVAAGQVMWWHAGSAHQPASYAHCDDAYNDVIAWRPATPTQQEQAQ